MRRGFVRNLTLAFVYATYFPLIVFTFIIVWLDRKIGFPLPFPRTVEALAKKEKWCIMQLKKGGALPPDAVVHEYKVEPLNQAYIFRSNAGVAEIIYSLGGERKTLKLFVKFAPTMGSLWNRVTFNLQLNHIKETLFNRHFITQDNLPAPKPYYAQMSVITGNLCLITEHFSDSIQCPGVENFPPAYAEMAVENLALLHARYWRLRSGKMKNVFRITNANVDLFDSFVAFSWSIPARKITVKSWMLMNHPETVLHGDARIGNMLFPADDGSGRFALIDWQSVRKGKAAFDLSYFLLLGLTADMRPQHEQRLIEMYHVRLHTYGVKNYTRQQLEDDYRHACLCVLVLLSLPMLSGEASVEGDAALIFVYGMNIWRERLKAKFDDFDYLWMAKNYEITETEARSAVAEMLFIIEKRLRRISKEKKF